MKKYLSLVSFLTFSLVMSQTKNFIDLPYVETSASIDTLVTPDRIYLNITIQEKDSKGRKSVEEQENRMADELKRIGIDLEKQLTISNLSSNFKNYFLRSKTVLKSKQFVLVVYDGLTAGKVLAALEDIGIANTYLSKTEYSKMDELELNLKSKAILKAKKKAEVLTFAIGQKVGSAIHISDNSYFRATSYQKAYAPRMEKRALLESAPEPLDVDFEKIKVETTINAKFQLLQ